MYIIFYERNIRFLKFLPPCWHQSVIYIQRSVRKILCEDPFISVKIKLYSKREHPWLFVTLKGRMSWNMCIFPFAQILIASLLQSASKQGWLLGYSFSLWSELTQGAQWGVDLISLWMRWPWQVSCVRPSRRERLLWKRHLFWLQLHDWKTLFNSCGFIRCCTQRTFLGFLKKKKETSLGFRSLGFRAVVLGLMAWLSEVSSGDGGFMPDVWAGLAWVWKGVDGAACRWVQCLWEARGQGCRGRRGVPDSSDNSRVALQDGAVTDALHEMDLRISKQTVSST